MNNVKNIINDRGNKVANQFKIATDKGVYFQSYESVVCFVPSNYRDGNKVILGGDWNYSRTTIKHLKTFLKGCYLPSVNLEELTTQDIKNHLEKDTFRFIRNLNLATDTTPPKVDFKRVNNDTYGNPRYVCHFLNFAQDYDKALLIANEMGGSKFNNKQYGGGIVFQSYNLAGLEKEILEIK
jgi:hypothetical protein